MFHKTSAERKNDLLDIFRPEVTAGRLNVMKDEERSSRTMRGEREERAEIRRMTSFERFVSGLENLI